MKRFYKYRILSLLLLATISFTNAGFAQSDAMIENIDFYAEGENLVIKYDIVNAKSSELFEIWIKLTTESGKVIMPKSTTGDVGSDVAGGPNKRIVWDLKTDEIKIAEAFDVEVFARSNYVEPKEVRPKKDGVGVGTAVLLSAILPGLGKTIAKGSGAQWMWGVVGYGCIAGSIVMNNNAYNALEDYRNADNPEERDDYFTEAENYDLYSKIFLGTAATIWVIDLITTATTASKLRKQKNNKYSINYTVDPFSGKPLIGLTMRF
jgi:hypothetical protein